MQNILTTVSPAGIPIRVRAHPHKQPLDPGLRQTIGLPAAELTLTVSLPAKVKESPAWEAARRIENARLCNSTLLPNLPEANRSPQCGGTERFDGGYDDGCQYGKSGYRNRGKKPEYKDRRLRAAGSGKTRARNAQL